MAKSFLILTLLSSLFVTKSNVQENYLSYHAQVIKCEQLIVEGKFAPAIDTFDVLFSQFDFIFLRDVKVATELSAYEKDYKSAFKFIRRGIKTGWALGSIKKNNRLKLLRKHSEWTEIVLEYDSLHQTYLSRLNVQVKERVHDMFKKDQKKALGALLRIGQKAQDKYAERRFAPQSEKHLRQLSSILGEHGYPGEMLIGNSIWAVTILSHHNSISVDYNSNDTLYSHLKPKLMNALKRGEISPYELSQIEDWRTAVQNSHQLTSFGHIGKIPDENELRKVNENRAEIGLRSIELRNSLVDIEKSTGMNLYLPKGWQNGKIAIANK